MASVADSHFKQRAVIEFLVHENESVVNIHKHLCAVYGSCAVDRSTAGRWAKRVKASGSAEAKLHDLWHAGRPATANTPDMLNCADAIICADQHITTRQLALQLSINTGKFGLARIQQKCCSSMIMHALTQA
jgi:transposase